MPHRRRLLMILVSCLTVWALAAAWAGPAAAQARIPQEVVVATSSLTDAQSRALRQYVHRWGGVFTEAMTNEQVSDVQVAEAREQLLSPLRTPGATDFFKRRYSTAVTELISPLMDGDRLIVRLNAMIVATRLTDHSAGPLAEKGIADPSPSVRYWAAKAIASLVEAEDSAGEPILDVADRLALLRTLEEVGVTEDSAEVLQQVMLAMAATGVPSAKERLLDLLGARLAWHVDRPYEPYLAESSGLRAVYQSLLRTRASDTAHIRQLAAIAHRYMNLISRSLAEADDRARDADVDNPVNRELRADHAAMLELCEYALQYCHDELESTEQRPASIIQKIPLESWNQINLIVVNGWGDVLKAPPFNLTGGDLAIVGN